MPTRRRLSAAEQRAVEAVLDVAQDHALPRIVELSGVWQREIQAKLPTDLHNAALQEWLNYVGTTLIEEAQRLDLRALEGRKEGDAGGQTDP